MNERRKTVAQQEEASYLRIYHCSARVQQDNNGLSSCSVGPTFKGLSQPCGLLENSHLPPVLQKMNNNLTILKRQLLLTDPFIHHLFTWRLTFDLEDVVLD